MKDERHMFLIGGQVLHSGVHWHCRLALEICGDATLPKVLYLGMISYGSFPLSSVS